MSLESVSASLKSTAAALGHTSKEVASLLWKGACKIAAFVGHQLVNFAHWAKISAWPVIKAASIHMYSVVKAFAITYCYELLLIGTGIGLSICVFFLYKAIFPAKEPATAS